MIQIKREPAVIIGIIGAVVLAVIQTLAGQGVIHNDIAATIIGFIDNQSTPAAPLDGWGIPIVLGFITRFVVYSPATVEKVAAQAAASGDPTVREGPP